MARLLVLSSVGPSWMGHARLRWVPSMGLVKVVLARWLADSWIVVLGLLLGLDVLGRVLLGAGSGTCLGYRKDLGAAGRAPQMSLLRQGTNVLQLWTYRDHLKYFVEFEVAVRV